MLNKRIRRILVIVLMLTLTACSIIAPNVNAGTKFPKIAGLNFPIFAGLKTPHSQCFCSTGAGGVKPPSTPAFIFSRKR